jgi:secreted Zn-dependent insulinase-like peptidase
VLLQFFIEPLISKDGIARERQAVDSEHSKNLQSDVWRQQQLWHTVSAPGHPFSRFFTGNLATLATIPEGKGVDVHARLWDFYNEQYSANRMKLCVLGRESLDELQDMVERMFAAVPDKSAPPELVPSCSLHASCHVVSCLLQSCSDYPAKTHCMIHSHIVSCLLHSCVDYPDYPQEFNA